MRSTSAPSVVDFPDPVGPVSTTSPRVRQASFCTGRDAEPLDSRNLARNRAKHPARAVMIAQRIRAEPRYIGNLVCEIGVVRLAILGEVSLGHDRD